jgi:hypothetical protein
MCGNGICGLLLSSWAALALGAACLDAAAICGESQLQASADDAAVTIKEGDRLVFEYLFGKVPFKPYARQVLSPGGVNVARDQVADHIHHHGLMYAIKVDGVNFWEETGPAGKEKHAAVSDVKTSVKDGLATASFAERLEWAAADGKALMQEARQIAVYRGADLAATLVTWRTTLAPAEGTPEIKLGGNHYHGLGIRFMQSMDRTGEFFTGEGAVKGEIVRGDEQLTKATWCAYAAECEGKPVTVAMFDHPDNPRKVLWFSMTKPFAYMSATMNLHREPLPVQAGKPASLCYGVAVWDGKLKADEIEKLYQRWLQIEKAK